VHNANHLDIENGIHHMIDALNMVYTTPSLAPSRSIRCLFVHLIASDGCYQLIYRDLTKLGFRIGAPNRITNEDVYDLYVKALTAAVDSIHRAGVIHVDLFLSNVKWLNSEDAVWSRLRL